MRLVLILVLGLLLTGSPLQNAAFGGVKAGGPCSKLGITSNVSGKTFTCIKSGKKLIWNKGVTALNATPTKSPTSTLSPMPTPSPTPSSKASGAPVTTEQELPEYWPLDKPANADLALIADASVRKYILDAITIPKINVLTGPRTDKLKAKDYLKFLEKAAMGWGKDWMPDEVDVALANVSDYDWINGIWTQYGLNRPPFDNSKASWERNGNQCNQGSASFNLKPFFWGCLPDQNSNIVGLNKFGPHEYTHLAQYGIIYYQGGKRLWNLPVLFSEGSADFYGVTYASTAENAKQNWSSFWKSGYMGSDARIALKQANTDEIESLLLDAMLDARKVNSHWYWTGAYATMRLVAAKGHQGFVKFMRNTGESADVFKSFESVYGMKFENFAKIIAPEIKVLTNDLRS